MPRISMMMMLILFKNYLEYGVTTVFPTLMQPIKDSVEALFYQKSQTTGISADPMKIHFEGRIKSKRVPA